MTRIRRIVTYLAMAACLSACVLQPAVEPSKKNVTESTQDSAPSKRHSTPGLAVSNAQTAGERSLPADFGESQQPTTINSESIQPVNARPDSPGPKTARASGRSPMTLMCKKIAAKLGHFGVDNCLQAGLSQTGHYSVNGLPILHKVYLPKPGLEPLGRVTVIGGTHGDELSAIALVFKWLQQLDRHHSGLFHWTIVPLLNPDGALANPATRVNANGIDLNRNLPTPNWKQRSQANWLKRVNRSALHNPGFFPASEPENKWLIEHIETFKPDVIISVHSLYNLVDYDAPDRSAAPKRIGMLRRSFLGTYPGSLGNYAGIQQGIPVITLELKDAHVLPKASQISHMWSDLVAWLKGHVPNLRVASARRVQGEQIETATNAAETDVSRPSGVETASVGMIPGASDKELRTTEPRGLQAQDLMARGNALLADGDLAGARLFFELVHRKGIAAGATGVGKTYDPVFYGTARVEGTQPNPALARDWYQKAAGAGDEEGTGRLAELNAWLERAALY